MIDLLFVIVVIMFIVLYVLFLIYFVKLDDNFKTYVMWQEFQGKRINEIFDRIKSLEERITYMENEVM